MLWHSRLDLRRCCLVLLVIKSALCLEVQTIFAWPIVQYSTDCGSTLTVSNAVIIGLKYFNGAYFAIVPRWWSGMPATLTKVTVDSSGSPSLEAFPSCEMRRGRLQRASVRIEHGNRSCQRPDVGDRCGQTEHTGWCQRQ